MKKSAVALCLSRLVLWPLAVSALDVEYPTLGIKLPNLPDDSKSLGAHELVKEIRTQIMFGGASIARISRLDEPVPTGNFADDGYRDALLKKFDIHPKGGALRAVSIAGEPRQQIVPDTSLINEREPGSLCVGTALHWII